jgi:hypothetical protein
MGSKIIKISISATYTCILAFFEVQMESKWCFPGTRNSFFATYTCIQALFEVKMESIMVKNSILEVNICNPMLSGCQSAVRSVQCQFVDTLSSEIKFATQFESKSKICQKSNSRHNLKRFAAPMAPKSAFTPLIAPAKRAPFLKINTIYA